MFSLHGARSRLFLREGQKGSIRALFVHMNGQKIKKPPVQAAAGLDFWDSGDF